MEIFFEIHRDIPREGPGSRQSTKKAFSLLDNVSIAPRILDIGCGPGIQTIELAKLSKGEIVALDNHQPYLDVVAMASKRENLHECIRPVYGSMFAMDFAEQSFDIIWAEGAIYIIGFEEGLRQWRRFLKPRGYLAVTEVSWLEENPPAEIYEFWHEAYPDIRSVAENIQRIESCGYRNVDHFALPESDWWQDYYNPIEARILQLREKYAGNEEALAKIAAEYREVELYRQYSRWYGYVFYIMQN